VYDADNQTDHFHQNPVQTVEFRNLTSWKNNRNGAIASNVGDVRFVNFKVADNILAGIEFEKTNSVKGIRRAGVYNSTMVAKTNNTFDGDLSDMMDKTYGVIAPRSEFFTISGAKFVNYDFKQTAALGDCSHCFHGAATDSGSRTYFTEKLQFYNVTKRIKHQYPYSGIFHDMDGSLTNMGAHSYATFYYPHLMQPGCERNEDLFDGVICNSSAPLRRVSFHGSDPENVMRGMSLYILKYDDKLFENPDSQIQYISNITNYSKIV
jgi:hypothetical protein